MLVKAHLQDRTAIGDTPNLTFLVIDSLLFQQLAQLLYLLLELANNLRVRVLVDHSLANNLFRSVCISAQQVRTTSLSSSTKCVGIFMFNYGECFYAKDTV